MEFAWNVAFWYKEEWETLFASDFREKKKKGLVPDMAMLNFES